MHTVHWHTGSSLTHAMKTSVRHGALCTRWWEARLLWLAWIPRRDATPGRPITVAPLWCTLCLLCVLALPRLATSIPSGSHDAVPAATKQKLAKVQMPFITNQGQIDKAVQFYARTFAGTVFVTATDWVDLITASATFGHSEWQGESHPPFRQHLGSSTCDISGGGGRRHDRGSE